MADKKISELDAITGANTAATDVFVVVDTSTGQTKKITREELNNAIEQDVLSSIDIDTINGDFSVNGNINLGDNNKAIFGAGSDLQIYHDGSNSYIVDNGTGDLLIRAENNLFLKRTNSDETYLSGAVNGAVTLFHNNNPKIATTISGIDVTGTVTADGLTVDGSSAGRVTLGTFTNTTNAAGTEAAIALRNQATGNADVSLVASRIGANFGSDFYIETSDSTDGTNRKRLNIAEDGDISFYEDTGTTAKLFWDASAESLGIGTSSVDTLLHLSKTTGGSVIRLENPDVGLSNGEVVGKIEFETQDVGGAGVNSFIQAVGRGTGGANNLEFATGTAGSPSVAMTIQSDQKVGIGVTSPARQVHLHDASGDNNLHITNSTTGATATDGFSLVSQSSTNDVLFNQREAANMLFFTSGLEAARLDASGNLLVGTTTTDPNSTAGAQLASNGRILATVDGGNAGYFNRLTSDGELVRFEKDGTTVGSIYTNAADGGSSSELCFASGNTGLKFDDTNNYIRPTNSAGANRDNIISLGKDDSRFKDLYLGGTAYVGGNIDFSSTSRTIGYDNSSGGTNRIAQIEFYNSSDGSMRLSTDNSSTGGINFYTEGAERMRIARDGSVGIGTSSPDAKLTISGSGTSPSFRLYNGGNTADITSYTAEAGLQLISYQSDNGSPYTKTSAIIANGDGTVPSELQFWTKTNGQSSPAERLRIDSSGDVNIYGTDNRPLAITSFDTVSAGAGWDLDATSVSGVVTISTAGTERMRITSAGLVGIGTSSPSHKFHVSGSNSAARFSDDGTGFNLDIEHDTSNGITTLQQTNSGGDLRLQGGSASGLLLFDTGGSERMRIDSSGNAIFTKSGGAYLQLKDASAVRGAINVETSDGLVFTTGSSFTERMRIDSSGNVGIGESNPDNALHITGAATSGARIKLEQTTAAKNSQVQQGSTGMSIAANGSSNPMLFETNGAERMRIDSSGNVIVKSGGELQLNRADNARSMNLYTDGDYGTIETSTDPLKINAASGRIVFEIASTERMRIDSSGNMLVGQTVGNVYNQSSVTGLKLDGANGNIQTARANNVSLLLNRYGSDGAIANFYKDGTVVGNIGVDNSNNLVIEGDSSHSGIQFGTGIILPHKNGALIHAGISFGNSDWRFQNLYLSGTAYAGGLEVNSGTANLTATFQSTDTTALIAIKDDTTSSDTHGVGSVGDNLNFYANGSERMRITSGGLIGIGTSSPGGAFHLKTIRYDSYPIFQTTSDSFTPFFINFQKTDGTTIGSIRMTGTTGVAFNTTSDYRLKENVTGISDGIERVKQLNPSRFNFISDAGITVDGFLAHEAQTVVPQAVTGEKDAVDEDGNPEYQSIDHSKLVPLLTAALQEAIAKIEDLEKRVATLEGN